MTVMSSMDLFEKVFRFFKDRHCSAKAESMGDFCQDTYSEQSLTNWFRNQDLNTEEQRRKFYLFVFYFYDS